MKMMSLSFSLSPFMRIGSSLLFLLLLFPLSFQAQQADSSDVFQNEAGFVMGSTVYYGPAYRIWWRRFGLQASLYASYAWDRRGDRFRGMRPSLTLYFKPLDFQKIDILLYKGFGWNYREQRRSIFPYEETWSGSVGIGIDLVMVDRLNFLLKGGLRPYEGATWLTKADLGVGFFYRF